MGPIGGVVKLIGSGIGLANEAYAHNKQQRQLKKEGKGKEAAVEAREVDDFLSPQPSNEQRRPSSTANSTHGSDDDSDDDELWQLDEAAEAADRKQHPSAYNTPAQTPSLEYPPAYTVEELVDDFIEHHPELPPSYSPAVGKLSAPVILPQKRPRNKGRGFVRAYAPALEECGIDQATFLDFLDTFDKSTKVRLQAYHESFQDVDSKQLPLLRENILDSMLKLNLHRRANTSRSSMLPPAS